MTRIRIFTDEDIYGAIAPALRKAGIDAISTPEAGRLATSDESQLEWASANDRSIVTFNVAHFASLHRDWMRSGRSHAGVILSSQQPIGELLRRLGKLLDALDADSMRDRLEFLADWR
jgi:hypothetical protein